ncbi:MAG: NAD(P)/FAD-dependent oxidoreductase [Gammaproteobacteria bacterium]|jgi:cyclohexanone monooxygenase|nr:NAD(P)/FAD-dependent oxidoreductase [Gammaproteobacteria bacterium]MBT6586925.1 NAD(P)/FAD-dependent oxidoreductase [Gammaproteobacteria bacterium]
MQCKSQKFDVVIVGAGFAGMYMLHRLRKLGLSTVVFEAGDDVGGTWYWNRYPGARCDAESLAYSFSFSSELEQEWEWSERYAPQPEILEYARHVSRRFDLRKDIHFETRVMSAHYQDDSLNWQLETDKGDSVVASFCVMATGCLSVPQLPDIPGVQNFKGNLYQASKWPHEPVSFKNQKVGIIGTGSSGIQAIPVIAEEAEHLTVFQRTPNFSVPAKNEPLDQNWVDEFKKNYRAHRENHKHAIGSGFGDLKIEPIDEPMEPILRSQLSEDQATQILEDAWVTGGAKFMGAIGDQLMNEEANQFAKEFVHRKIHETVADKDTANLLCPTNHPIGTRRICVDIGYYETYNRENVTLVSVKDNPIEEITESGVMVNGELTALDTLVLATGFDAMTGALLNMDIRGKGGLALSEKWHAGPRSYLGIAVADFPNLFTITGPGSPSVLSNMMVSIEQHVDWMIDCLAHMKEQDLKVFEAQSQAEDQWVSHVNDVASMTLFPKGGSWYLGANVKGKPRIFMPYAAGVGVYREVCDQVTAKGYEGFTFH